MVFKIITAHDAHSGATILVDGNACVVKSCDISKTGKHGASKCRIEAVGIIDGKKRVIAVPGSEKLEVPLIEKKKAQILSISAGGDMANVMDLESFENIDLPIVEELRGNLSAEDQVEYTVVDEKLKVIMRKI